MSVAAEHVAAPSLDIFLLIVVCLRACEMQPLGSCSPRKGAQKAAAPAEASAGHFNTFTGKQKQISGLETQRRGGGLSLFIKY